MFLGPLNMGLLTLLSPVLPSSSPQALQLKHPLFFIPLSTNLSCWSLLPPSSSHGAPPLGMK